MSLLEGDSVSNVGGSGGAIGGAGASPIFGDEDGDGDDAPGGASTGGATTGGASAGGAASGGTGVTMGTAGAAGAPMSNPPLVLLVVDDVPISTDRLVEQRLVELGADVVPIAESVVTDSDTIGYDLIVVSSSADGVETPQSLKLVPVPMLLLEPSVSIAMGFGNSRRLDAQTQGVVVQPEHPISAGLSGTVTLCSGTASFQGVAVPNEARVVELTSGTAALVFFFKAGEVVGEPLQAARVGLSVLKPSQCQTDASWRFFDGAYSWLLDSIP